MTKITLVLSVLVLAACTPSDREASLKIGLITKTDTHPFFIAMRAGAEAAAQDVNGELFMAAGSSDLDHAAQAAAIADMVAAGVQTILISPSDSAAIVPDIQKARSAGVMVIALDTPTDPQDATDALIGTDNFEAGRLIGRYARAALAGKPVKVATLNLAPGITVSQLRHDGFLQGFGLEETDPHIVCSRNTRGERALGQTAMAACLAVDPDINLVYTYNELSAFGAWAALKDAGRDQDTLIVSIDGSCEGVRAVAAGRIAATAQQSPVKMAALGVAAAARYAKTGEQAAGYTDTGITLITNTPLPGLESQDTTFGTANCY